MKSLFLLMSSPFILLSAPAKAQAVAVDDCPVDGSIQVTCFITVTGNLPTAKAERTEGISVVEPSTDRLENSLLAVPGLQQFRRSDARSANPTSQGVTLRGLGGNASSRALLFLDDVPQADPFGGWVSWPGYDALNLASIRVRKGGGQPSAGPGALAGVIELDSVQNRREGSLHAAYGSRNSAEAKGNLIRGGLSASARYARGDGFVPIITSQRGPADRRAPYEQAGIALRGVALLSDDVQLQANLRGFTDERERGIAFSDNHNSGVDASLRVVDRIGDWQWSATGYIQLREFSSQFGAVSADRATVTPTLDQFATPSTGLGARFELRPPIGDRAELRLGGEWRRTIGETKERFSFVAGAPTRLRTAGGQADSYGGFVELTYQPSDTLTVSTGGRLDRWQITDGFRREVNIGGSVRSDDRFADRKGTEWTGRAGIGWDFAGDWTLHAAAYRAWRLPTLNELYRPFRVGADATAANEALRPERVKGVDAGLRYNGGDIEMKATLFYSRLDGAIANVTQGQGPGLFPGVGFVAAGGTYRQRQNLDAIVSKGIEFEASFGLAESLKARFGYAYIDAEVRGSGLAAAIDGLRPAQVPRHFGNASLEYEFDNFFVSTTMRYLGQQFEDDANVRVLDDALTADLSVGYRLGDALTFQLRGENLFDARVEAAISSSGVVERANPRTLWLGARWNFD